jgi:MtrB/PioB family decaheme-associated outer membrane protein
MKRRVGLVEKCVISAVLGGTALASTSALAQTAAPTPGAPDPTATTADPVPYWWFHGTVEAGGRAFLNNPQDGHQTATGPAGTPGTPGQSLAGYYEYSDVKPGAFGNAALAVGSKDGLYQFNFGGTNIGYNDQSYYFDFSKAGQHYFNFVWDETPHVYSTSALTPYVVSGNALTLPNVPKTAISALLLAPYAQPTTIGIQRDTASAQYRWTPDDAWDIKADYSHLTRTGTQVGAVDNGVSPGTMQIPKPVDDSTQNYGLNGEYVGTSPWGQRIVFKLGYQGSQYTDNYTSYTVANSATGLPGADISTWPSNQANGGSASLAADLPWKSRYAGTINYTMMTQNAAYDVSTLSPSGFPTGSLDGDINTALSNNILTTKITSDLTSKLSYRYYDFKNNTPEYVPNYTVTGLAFARATVDTISMGYIKQNAGEELNWRPTKEWNLGAAYGYERYDWTRADVNVTNESSGKIFADWKPNSWLTVRSSGSYGDRRYDNYNYLAYVGNFQWPNPPTGNTSQQYAASYRQLMIDNRTLWKANFSADVVAMRNLTITPTLKYEDANYGVDPVTFQQGLQDSRKWAAGVDATYVINPITSVMVGYMYEYNTQLLYGCSGEGSTAACGPQTLTNDASTIHTFTTALRYAAIPDKLDTELRYTASHGDDNMQLFVNGGPPTTGGQFPDDKTWFQRLDATATYKFDHETVARMGWKGDVKAKLHYAWERNSQTNWANDPLTPYSLLSTSTLFMAWNNPNYNVQMLMGSISASW